MAITNFMRRTLAAAHNDNNSKAITKDLCIANGVNDEGYELWKKDVKDLQDIVEAFVRAKHDPKVSADDANKLRNKIFASYKTLLAQGEDVPEERTLFVSKHDVDSLVGFCEVFAKSENGTVQVIQTEQKFRKLVESLIGCKMAGNAVLSNEDRDALSAQYKAKTSVNKIKAAIAEQEDIINNANKIIAMIPAENEVAIEAVRINTIAPANKTITELNNKLKEAEKIVNNGAEKFDEINSRIKACEEADIETTSEN